MMQFLFCFIFVRQYCSSALVSVLSFVPRTLWVIALTLTGLPAQHFTYVKNIDIGLPLFLFNYSDRKLYGIYEAASPGKMNIDPYGWTTDGSERTFYPAQVI